MDSGLKMLIEPIKLWLVASQYYKKTLTRAKLTGRLGQPPAGFLTVRRVRRDLPDVAALNADEHVLGLDVGVDDLALGVQVVQALKNLK